MRLLIWLALLLPISTLSAQSAYEDPQRFLEYVLEKTNGSFEYKDQDIKMTITYCDDQLEITTHAMQGSTKALYVSREDPVYWQRHRGADWEMIEPTDERKKVFQASVIWLINFPD